MWSLLGVVVLALAMMAGPGCRERLSSRPRLFRMSYFSDSPTTYHRIEIDSTVLKYTYYEAPETLVWVMQYPCYADSEQNTLTAILSQQDLDALAKVVNLSCFLKLPDTVGNLGRWDMRPPTVEIGAGRCCDLRTKVYINGPMPQAFKDVRAALAGLIQTKFGRTLGVAPVDSTVTTDLGPMDSALTARLAPPLSEWLARTAEGRPGFALSGFRRVSEDKVAIRPRPWSANELWADSVQVSLRQRFGYIRWSPDRGRYVDLNLRGEIVAVEGDTQFLADIDQTVILVDPRRTAAPLQNYGSGGRTEEAVWLDDSTLVLAGWEEAQPPPDVVKAPFVRVLRLVSGRRTTYFWSVGDSR